MAHGPACCDAVRPALIVKHVPANQPAAHLTGRKWLGAQRALCGLEDCVAPSCPDLLAGTPWVPQCFQCVEVNLRWIVLRGDLRGSIKGQQ
eukprot:10714525-Alexandrium_andersonii.AAC.1